MAKKKTTKRKTAKRAPKRKVVELKNKAAMNTVHLVFEILAAAGFAIGLIPLGYLFSMWWVIPMTLISMIISVMWSKKTLTLDVVTFIMSLLSIIPILGFVARVIGIITAAVAAKDLI